MRTMEEGNKYWIYTVFIQVTFILVLDCLFHIHSIYVLLDTACCGVSFVEVHSSCVVS